MGSPLLFNNLLSLPQQVSGPLLFNNLLALPEQISGPLLFNNLLALPDQVSGPLLFDNLQPLIMPDFSYGGSTGDHVSALAPGREFGSPTGSFALFPPSQTFSSTTGETSSALAAARSFGSATGGVVDVIDAPINLTATVLGAGEIQLDWIDPGPEEDGFRIERSLTGLNDWETIGVVAADVETFEDRLAVPLVVYDYRVFGFDAFRDSLSSNIATAVTPLPPDLSVGPPPTAPTDPIRNRIDPDNVEFKSPGTYGLEKGPDGGVTGFKF